ncbi:MAG: hypothetical protein ACO25B_12365 [Chitinophagaceae bacterium]
MRKIFFILFSVALTGKLSAQKIVPLVYKDKKYEVLDLSSKGKMMWGGYEKISGRGAASESDGQANTEAIVGAVGDNTGYDGKPYAARICREARAGNKEDWYLPSKEESDIVYAFKDKFNVEERASIWTSTEINGTQAVSKYWYTGAFYNVQKVDLCVLVCIRKVE